MLLDQFVGLVRPVGAVPLFSFQEEETNLKLVDLTVAAAEKAGHTGAIPLEFTGRPLNWGKLFVAVHAHVQKNYRGKVILGVGSCHDAAAVKRMHDMGAEFAVSYGHPPGMVQECKRYNLTPVPAFENMEGLRVLDSFHADQDACGKFFPSDRGHAYLKSIALPLGAGDVFGDGADARGRRWIIATGISKDDFNISTLTHWFRIKERVQVIGVGMSGAVFREADVLNRRWQVLVTDIKDGFNMVREAMAKAA